MQRAFLCLLLAVALSLAFAPPTSAQQAPVEVDSDTYMAIQGASAAVDKIPHVGPFLSFGATLIFSEAQGPSYAEMRAQWEGYTDKRINQKTRNALDDQLRGYRASVTEIDNTVADEARHGADYHQKVIDKWRSLEQAIERDIYLFESDEDEPAAPLLPVFAATANLRINALDQLIVLYRKHNPDMVREAQAERARVMTNYNNMLKEQIRKAALERTEQIQIEQHGGRHHGGSLHVNDFGRYPDKDPNDSFFNGFGGTVSPVYSIGWWGNHPGSVMCEEGYESSEDRPCFTREHSPWRARGVFWFQNVTYEYAKAQVTYFRDISAEMVCNKFIFEKEKLYLIPEFLSIMIRPLRSPTTTHRVLAQEFLRFSPSFQTTLWYYDPTDTNPESPTFHPGYGFRRPVNPDDEISLEISLAQLYDRVAWIHGYNFSRTTVNHGGFMDRIGSSTSNYRTSAKFAGIGIVTMETALAREAMAYLEGPEGDDFRKAAVQTYVDLTYHPQVCTFCPYESLPSVELLDPWHDLSNGDARGLSHHTMIAYKMALADQIWALAEVEGAGGYVQDALKLRTTAEELRKPWRSLTPYPKNSACKEARLFDEQGNCLPGKTCPRW